MSQIARVFVVLNLLVAAGFMFAASTFLALNDNYKKNYEGEVAARKADNDRHVVELQKKDKSIEDLANQNRALQENSGRVEGNNTALTQQVSSLESSLKTKDAQIAELTRVNNEHATTAQRMQAENSRLVEVNQNLDKAQREAVAKMEKAIGDLNDEQKKNLDATNKIADQEKELVARAELISQKDLLIEYAKTKGIDFEKALPMPPLQGTVVNADTAMKLVQANIGTDNGVQRGFVLDIVRGATYIGRFRVDTVFPKTCAGILEISAAGQQVMVGDRVTNTLN